MSLRVRRGPPRVAPVAPSGRLGGLLSLATFLALSVNPSPVAAQESPDWGAWLGIGFGGATADRTQEFEFGFVVEAGYWSSSHVVTIRRFGVTQITTPVLADTGLLYGHRFVTETGVLFVIAGGIAYVADPQESGVGIPLEVGFTVGSASVRPGLRMFVNLNNSLGSFGGILLTLQLGRLR